MESQQLTQSIRVASVTLWPTSHLEFRCPLQWTTNQIKCYLCLVEPRLNFDHFELALGGQPLDHSLTFEQILHQRRDKRSISLQIVMIQSTKFIDYYSKRMQKILDSIQQDLHLIVDPQSTLACMPLLNKKYFKLVSNQNSENARAQPANNIPPNNNQQGVQANLKILAVLGLVYYLYHYASWSQTILIILIYISHYFIGRPHPNPVPAQPQPQPVLANVEQIQVHNLPKFYAYKYCEIAYCLFMSLFPNWNVQDYLLRHRQKLHRLQQEVYLHQQ